MSAGKSNEISKIQQLPTHEEIERLAQRGRIERSKAFREFLGSVFEAKDTVREPRNAAHA